MNKKKINAFIKGDRIFLKETNKEINDKCKQIYKNKIEKKNASNNMTHMAKFKYNLRQKSKNSNVYSGDYDPTEYVDKLDSFYNRFDCNDFSFSIG